MRRKEEVGEGGGWEGRKEEGNIHCTCTHIHKHVPIYTNMYTHNLEEEEGKE